MQPSGIITFTTDFGHKGPFAAVMKGVILSRFPDANVVDLLHDIPAQWPPEAGFWVRRAYAYFPEGSVHVAIVDPGVGTERDILIAEVDGHCFMAPDNGLLAELLENASSPVVCRLDLERAAPLLPEAVSSTFHGRDIFAPVAAALASGAARPEELGPRVEDWTPGWLDPPSVGSNRISGVIVTVDTFGNLISNIDAGMLATIPEPVAEIGGHRLSMHSTYGRAEPGALLALINSFDVLEIAKAEGSAAEALGLERGAPITVTAATR